MELFEAQPIELFRDCIVSYLTVYDLARFDTACTSHKFRDILMARILNATLPDPNLLYPNNFFLWLRSRQIFLSSIKLDDSMVQFLFENSHVISRVTNVVIERPNELQQTLRLSTVFPNLISVRVSKGDYLTDDGMISIFIALNDLQNFTLEDCRKVGDKSIIMLSDSLTGLLVLVLYNCTLITDEAIICISNKCSKLLKLTIVYSNNPIQIQPEQISNSGMSAVLSKCTRLTSLIFHNFVLLAGCYLKKCSVVD